MGKAEYRDFKSPDEVRILGKDRPWRGRVHFLQIHR